MRYKALIGLAGLTAAGLYAIRQPIKRCYVRTTENKDSVRFAGIEGEMRVAALLEKSGYMVVSNLIIPRMDGTETDADLVVCLPYAIYVIEVKNHSGSYKKCEDGNYYHFSKYGEKKGKAPTGQARYSSKTVHSILKREGYKMHCQPLVVIVNNDFDFSAIDDKARGEVKYLYLSHLVQYLAKNEEVQKNKGVEPIKCKDIYDFLCKQRRLSLLHTNKNIFAGNFGGIYSKNGVPYPTEKKGIKEIIVNNPVLSPKIFMRLNDDELVPFDGDYDGYVQINLENNHHETRWFCQINQYIIRN